MQKISLKTKEKAQKKLSIIRSEEYNPWYNLALEEYLFNNLKENEIILYLWQNDHTVVIGRNQNAWQECRSSLLEDEDGGFLARRLSGGGAVYHDLGNLNFTFILKKDNYDVEKQLSVILKAVKNLGIDAEFTGRNDITVSDKKISGNAFYHSHNNSYHHGTILYDTDVESLVKYLQVSEDKIKSKGIESVRSRVINLKNIKENLELEAIKREIEEVFISLYDEGNYLIDKKSVKASNLSNLNDLYKKYSSWEWRYGKSPDFDIYLKKRFDWGGVELGISSKNGQIEAFEIFTDAVETDLFLKINDLLKGERVNKEIIINKLAQLKDESNNKILNDLRNWISNSDL